MQVSSTIHFKASKIYVLVNFLSQVILVFLLFWVWKCMLMKLKQKKKKNNQRKKLTTTYILILKKIKAKNLDQSVKQ